MTSYEKVSIITATRNSAANISSCIKSVDAQDWDNKEHIIVDGNSADATLSILSNFNTSYRKIVSEPDDGIYDALNKGIAMSTGEIIGFMHSDDMYESKSSLSTIMKKFDSPDVSAVYGDLLYVSKYDSNQIVRYWRSSSFSQKKLKMGWMPPHPTLYVRRKFYNEIFGFSKIYRISSDYDSILKLFSKPQFYALYVPTVIVRMRTGGASNANLRSLVNKSIEDFKVLRANNFSILTTCFAILCKNISKIGQFSKKI